MLCDVIVTDRSQFGHGLVNHRPRFLIMNEREGAGGVEEVQGGSRWSQVESGAGTFLVVMMDHISHGQITVIISHQVYTLQSASQSASQHTNQNQIRPGRKTN